MKTFHILALKFKNMIQMFYSFLRWGVLLALLIFLSISTHAQKHENENVILYGGNAFYWADNKTDTLEIVDPETGESVITVRNWEAAFTKMNDEPIYNSRNFKETTPPVFEYNHQDAEQYLETIFRSKPTFKETPAFSIQKMVISKAGKPIYFEIQFDDIVNNKALKLKWGNAIEKTVKSMPAWKAGVYKGYPVLYFLDISFHIEAH